MLSDLVAVPRRNQSRQALLHAGTEGAVEPLRGCLGRDLGKFGPGGMPE